MLTLIFSSVLFPAIASAEDGFNSDDYLLGDWNGARSHLSEHHGLNLEIVSTADIFSNVAGGVRHGTKVPLNFDLTALWDTKKAGLWNGGKVFAYILGNTGSKPSTIIGETQIATNIEAEESVKLYELWYEQTFSGDLLSLLVGLHDYNSEFDSLEYAGTLINSSFGIQIDISQVAPSIFSTTSLAARARIAPTTQSYVMAAVYDGVPGREDNPRGTHIILHQDDGVFLASEAGLTGPEDAPGDYYKLALGGWYHTKKYEDYSGDSQRQNGGLYLIGEKRLWSEDDAQQGLGGFFQLGWADASRNQVSHYFGGGLSYTGPIPTRDEDVVTCGFASAVNSGGYRRNNDGATLAETVFELSYRAKVTGWLAVQPDLQFIVNPGTDPAVDDALIIGSRVEVSL